MDTTPRLMVIDLDRLGYPHDNKMDTSICQRPNWLGDIFYEILKIVE